MPASRSIFTERVTDVSVNLLIVGDRFFALNRLDFGLDPRSTAIPSLNLLPARAAWKTARAIRRDRGFTSSCPPIIYASRNYLSQHLVEHHARQHAASLRVHAPFALTSDCAHALPRFFSAGDGIGAPPSWDSRALALVSLGSGAPPSRNLAELAIPIERFSRAGFNVEFSKSSSQVYFWQRG